MLICKLKLRKKNDESFQSIFRVRVCALHTLGCHVDWNMAEIWFVVNFFRVAEKKSKLKNVWVVGYPVSWAPCWLKSSITWANWKVKIAVAEKEKGSQGFLFTGFVPTGWAPCCKWTKSWVLCCERTRNILSRTVSGSFTYVYTRGPWAVEYLAKLSQMLKIFLKSFKAMILGFDFI